MGIATEALPADQVLARAMEIAREIADNTAPAAVGVTKQLLYEMLGEGDREGAFYREWETFRWMGRQSDCAEGTQAFLDKRAPHFTGSKHAGLPAFDNGWNTP